MKKSIPSHYWGHPLNDQGIPHNTTDKTDPVTSVDHFDGTWYYGRSLFRDGTIIPWSRLSASLPDAEIINWDWCKTTMEWIPRVID